MKQVVKTMAIAGAAIFLLQTYAISAENENASGVTEAKRISVSGNIGVDASYTKTDYAVELTEDEKTSGLSATIELRLDMNIDKYVSGHIGFKYEDDETDASKLLDEGYFLFGGNDLMPAFLKAGKMYVPFGKFETTMISDPLTLEIGETRKTAVEAGFNYAGLYGSIYAFNGDVNLEGEDDRIDNYGAQIGYLLNRGAFSLDIGGGYINNIYESNGLMGMISEIEGEEYLVTLNDYIAGMTSFVMLKAWNFSLFGEYTAMLKDSKMVRVEISSGTPDTIMQKELKAWNIEAGYSFALAGKGANIFIGYQGVSNADTSFPETRYMGCFSLNILENTSAAIEYAYDIFENDDKADTITLKVEVAF